MNSQYSLNIDNEVISHFNAIISQSLITDEKQVIAAAIETIKTLNKAEHNAFITQHITTLEKMLNMLVDSKWALSPVERHQILSALVYLTKQDDVIPDEIPGIGLLDDCIVIDLVAQKIRQQLRQYKTFKQAQKVYAHDDDYSVDDWNDTKRMETFSRIRNRRLRKGRFA